MFYDARVPFLHENRYGGVTPNTAGPQPKPIVSLKGNKMAVDDNDSPASAAGRKRVVAEVVSNPEQVVSKKLRVKTGDHTAQAPTKAAAAPETKVAAPAAVKAAAALETKVALS